MLSKHTNQLCILFIVFLCVSCQAPRNNPLDPDNPRNTLCNIYGSVKSLSLPHQALSDVEILWQSEQRIIYSDANGTFHIENLSNTDGWLYFRASGFRTDSTYIAWEGKKQVDVQQYLNALPVPDSLVFATTIINRTPNIQILELVARAKITDADNDIDTVFFQCPALNFNTNLIYNSDTQFYERNHISMADLGISSAEAVVGRIFTLIVKDIYGIDTNINQSTVSRLIQEEIELVSPIGYEIVPSRPTLIWKPFTPGFHYHLKLEIFNRDAPDIPIWQLDQVSSSTNSIVVNQELPAGTYFWVVWAVDEFQNRCRSKAKNFMVE